MAGCRAMVLFRFATGANYYRFIGLEVMRPDGVGQAGKVDSPLRGPRIIWCSTVSWLHGTHFRTKLTLGISLSGMKSVASDRFVFQRFSLHFRHRDNVSRDMRSVEASATHKTGRSRSKTISWRLSGRERDVWGRRGDEFAGRYHYYQQPFLETMAVDARKFEICWRERMGSRLWFKNHLGLKNAARVLVEGNLMENSWAGFSAGWFHAILLTPKNQQHRNKTFARSARSPILRFADVPSLARGCRESACDFDFREMAREEAQALAGQAWSIHDVVLDDLNPQYSDGGTVFEIANGWSKNPLNTVTINHITGFPNVSTHTLTMGNTQQNAQMYGFVFTNNLFITADYPVWNSVGGSTSCAAKDVPITSIQKCLANSTFANNGLIAPPPQYPPSTWPAKNMFPTTVNAVEFTDFNNGNGGNYQLLSSSPYKNKGLDGKDLGADIAGLNAALANVE